MSSILVSHHGGVLSITLNRPDKLNAFNPEMHQLLETALERARDESSVRVVLLTGAGKGFCAGQDLSERNVAPGAAPIDLSVTIGAPATDPPPAGACRGAAPAPRAAARGAARPAGGAACPLASAPPPRRGGRGRGVGGGGAD